MATRNVWQSLAYSPLGVIVSPLANAYEKHPITDHHSAYQYPLVNVAELIVVKMFDAGHTISYVLNSGVSKPNLTKFLRDVGK